MAFCATAAAASMATPASLFATEGAITKVVVRASERPLSFEQAAKSPGCKLLISFTAHPLSRHRAGAPCPAFKAVRSIYLILVEDRRRGGVSNSSTQVRTSTPSPRSEHERVLEAD